MPTTASSMMRLLTLNLNSDDNNNAYPSDLPRTKLELELRFYIEYDADVSTIERFMEKNGYHSISSRFPKFSETEQPPIACINKFKILKNDQTEDHNSIGKEINSMIRKLDKLNMKYNHLFEEVNFSIGLY